MNTLKKEKYNNKIVMHLTDTDHKKVLDFIGALPYPVAVSSYARQVLLDKIVSETAKQEA